MPRGRMMRTAITASAISSTKTNRAAREAMQNAPATPAPQPTPQPVPVNNNSVDNIARLEQLASLRDSGILTEEEFSKKKQEILAEI